MSIFVENNVNLAEKCKKHMGRFVKVELKSGLKLEREITIPFIKAVKLGQFKVLTYLE